MQEIIALFMVFIPYLSTMRVCKAFVTFFRRDGTRSVPTTIKSL